ncbi:cytochrome C552 [Methylobacterium oxalidis]|uniref:cytochrome C552 n=1 Tax=Methylobacterium oxalidis TaxID=944322 RepID=UPI003314B92A
MTTTVSHRIGALVLAGLSMAAASPPASASPEEDHRIRGWTVAVQLCSRCHVIGKEPQDGGRVGPAFTTIAAMPSTTGLALNVFLQSHHQWMPSVRLDRDEMDAVIDYILSLKPPEPAKP